MKPVKLYSQILFLYDLNFILTSAIIFKDCLDSAFQNTQNIYQTHRQISFHILTSLAFEKRIQNQIIEFFQNLLNIVPLL